MRLAHLSIVPVAVARALRRFTQWHNGPRALDITERS
jgi:hypothetical protein